MGGKRIASPPQLPAVSKSHSVPICSWGETWETAAPVHHPWGDRTLTGGRGENSDPWSASPLLPGGPATSSWGHFDMVQDPSIGKSLLCSYQEPP